MWLNFKNLKNTPLNLMRQAGYSFAGRDERTGEEKYQRRLSAGADFPKFHAFVKKDGDFVFVNLHLDQKRASYGHHTAHSGEYGDSDNLEKEAAFIKQIFGE